MTRTPTDEGVGVNPLVAGPALDPTQTMVGTASGPGIYVAPVGTTPPVDAAAAWATPWLSLGYASDDGVTIGGDITSESFTPWQSVTPIKTIITERTRTLAFTMWQLNKDTLGIYFNQDLSAQATMPMSFDVASASPIIEHAIGIDAGDGVRKLRIIFLRATLQATGDLVLNKTAMVPLEVTLNALDSSGVMTHIYVA
jgi:hypothetical protein